MATRGAPARRQFPPGTVACYPGLHGGHARVTATPHDGASVRYPVSVKGVLLRDGSVVLIKNTRDEWELPGGKLEPDETLEGCVAREIAEELGITVTVGPIVDAWMYRIATGLDVLVLTYGCDALAWPAALASPEGNEVGLFPLDKIGSLRLPEGYRTSIRRWARMR